MNSLVILVLSTLLATAMSDSTITCILCNKEKPVEMRRTPPYGTGFMLSGLTVCQNERHCEDCLSKSCPECETYVSPPVPLNTTLIAVSLGAELDEVYHVVWTILFERGHVTESTTKEEFFGMLNEEFIDRWDVEDFFLGGGYIEKCPFDLN